MGQDEAVAMLEAGDLTGLRSAWAQIAPHLPQPESDGEMEITMHIVRTQSNRIRFRKRAYSHAWLTERSLPSYLPDKLKPHAERLYPRIVAAVGISVNAHSKFLKPAAKIIERAMCDAVEEVAADGQIYNNELIRQRMQEAKIKAQRLLFGNLSWPAQHT